MGRLTDVLLGFAGVGVMMIGFRPAWDIMFDLMNTTGTGLTGMESIVWRFAPIAIPVAAVVGGIVLIGRKRDDRREGETRW